MNETQINDPDVIHSVKYHIVKQFMEGEFWHTDKLVAYMSAIIFPFLGRVSNHINDNYSTQILRRELERFFKDCSSVKMHLSTLSFEKLVLFFAKEFCPTKSMIEKKIYITSAISLVESVNDDGYISLKGNDNVYKNIINIYQKDAYLFKIGRAHV